MPGVSVRTSANSAEKPAVHRSRVGLEPMWPALARGLIFLIALATPIVATLLSR
jgi:hypothetical protein